jgi:hypothetical protein
MPFRVILKRGGVEHPVGYSLLLASLAMVVCMLASVVISVNASNRAIRQNEAQEQAQRREARRAACLVVVAQDDAFRDPASLPVTKAGKQSAAAWRNLRQVFGCDKQE